MDSRPLGVSYALHQWPATLDLAGKVQIIETGGMKGRGKEMTRSELHDQIKANFGVHEVFSEYGMTEMLSQAYASSNGHFRLPPTLKGYAQVYNRSFVNGKYSSDRRLEYDRPRQSR